MGKWELIGTVTWVNANTLTWELIGTVMWVYTNKPTWELNRYRRTGPDQTRHPLNLSIHPWFVSSTGSSLAAAHGADS